MWREIPALKASMDSVRSKSEVKLLLAFVSRRSHVSYANNLRQVALRLSQPQKYCERNVR